MLENKSFIEIAAIKKEADELVSSRIDSFLAAYLREGGNVPHQGDVEAIEVDSEYSITVKIGYSVCGSYDHEYLSFPIDLINDPTPENIKRYVESQKQSKLQEEQRKKEEHERHIEKTERGVLARLQAKYSK